MGIHVGYRMASQTRCVSSQARKKAEGLWIRTRINDQGYVVGLQTVAVYFQSEFLSRLLQSLEIDEPIFVCSEKRSSYSNLAALASLSSVLKR
jgi:hypothetical protein